MQARIFGDPATTRMRPFEDISNKVRAFNRVRLGKRAVAVEKIVGSVGRSGGEENDTYGLAEYGDVEPREENGRGDAIEIKAPREERNKEDDVSDP
jgi:hypothetical protein